MNKGGSKSYKIEYIKEGLHRNGYIQELKDLSKFRCASKVAWLGIVSSSSRAGIF